MVRMGRITAALAAAGIAAALLFAGGCAKKAETKLEPKVSSPAIKVSGKLRAGVDLTYPPFGGEKDGTRAGLDLDVAAALAEQLGLAVEYVDVKASDAATALAEGRVDVVLSVPVSAAGLPKLALAGSYVTDAPGIFVSTGSSATVEPTMTLDSLPEGVIVAQKGSPAFWAVEADRGEGAAQGVATLREALQQVEQGSAQFAVGDILVGAYIARDMPTVHFAGQMMPATPLAVAVSAENSTLEDAVRKALDKLATDGVLETIRAKWFGELPKLESPAASIDETASAVASTTP